MGRSDIIADSITIIRNAYRANKEEAVIPYSKMLINICSVLKDQMYIENFSEMEEGKKQWIKVYLKYNNGRPAIMKIKRMSKPSRRYYLEAKKMKPVLNSKGVALVTTSLGVLTGKEAKSKNVGGEVICHVW